MSESNNLEKNYLIYLISTADIIRSFDKIIKITYTISNDDTQYYRYCYNTVTTDAATIRLAFTIAEYDSTDGSLLIL